MWPFLEYAPTMHESEQGKKRAGGHDISLHGRASEARKCCGKWLSVGTYLMRIAVFFLLALVLTCNDIMVRRLLLIALASYVIMRAWSGRKKSRESGCASSAFAGL